MSIVPRGPRDGSEPPIIIPGGWAINVCDRCDGRGWHWGFGETGHDPDWCLECGGAARWWVPATEHGAAALERLEVEVDSDASLSPPARETT